MLVDQHLKLPFELGLLCRVWRGDTRGHARHVLYDHESQAVSSPVEQVGFDLNLQQENRESYNLKIIPRCSS